jgi:IS30 family transposase
MMGTESKDCIVGMVERQTMYLWIGKLQARAVCCPNKAFIALIQSTDMPVNSIIADNGTEFHGHREIEISTGTNFIFATPHHARERGAMKKPTVAFVNTFQKGIPCIN